MTIGNRRDRRLVPGHPMIRPHFKCLVWIDTVEKGKNKPIKIFACERVETGFS
jgi:hypothetical protein